MSEATLDYAVDYYPVVLTELENVQKSIAQTNDYLRYLSGFGLALVVILLCYFTYKFFKIFFRR